MHWFVNAETKKLSFRNSPAEVTWPVWDPLESSKADSPAAILVKYSVKVHWFIRSGTKSESFRKSPTEVMWPIWDPFKSMGAD